MSKVARQSTTTAIRKDHEPGLPGEAPTDAAAVPPAYWRAFSVAAFAMNRFIVDQTLRAARQFENDTEAMIFFGVLAHLNVAHLMPPGTRPSQALDADGRLPEAQAQLRPIRLRDLCQITGRPRETIRRKLERLLAQGRILRVEGGFVLNAASVDEAMRALAVDGVRRYLATAEQIAAALHDAERALKTPARGPAA
jgi:hypothetical protein